MKDRKPSATEMTEAEHRIAAARAGIQPTERFEAKYPRIDHPANRKPQLPPGVKHVSQAFGDNGETFEEWRAAMEKRVYPVLFDIAERDRIEGRQPPPPPLEGTISAKEHKEREWRREVEAMRQPWETLEQAAQRWYKERDAAKPKISEEDYKNQRERETARHKGKGFEEGRREVQTTYTKKEPSHLRVVPPRKPEDDPDQRW